MNEENEQMNDNTVNETAQNTADNYRYICTMDNSTFEGKTRHVTPATARCR